MGPGGFSSLQNWRDPTTSGWVGSIPTRSRHHVPPFRSAAVRALHRLRRAAALAVVGACFATSAAAQRAPARRAPATPADTVSGPPLSPRRAFVYSALLPGYGQAKLQRYNAGALFVAIEMASIAMAAKSRTDLRQSERLYRDSIVVGYAGPDTAGVLTPTFQQCRTADAGDSPCPVTQARVRARRVHYEDWLAAVLFNHLFAGADAFVAAQLWDLPTQVSASPDGRGVTVAARIAF